MSALPPTATAKADIVPHNPKIYDGATRPDETPATFAELKPPRTRPPMAGELAAICCSLQGWQNKAP